jgi:type II secretory pathway component PulJ
VTARTGRLPEGAVYVPRVLSAAEIAAADARQQQRLDRARSALRKRGADLASIANGCGLPMHVVRRLVMEVREEKRKAVAQ